ncbi:MAG: Phosphopentomutase [Pseudidiomarina mangrovi]|nr:MAG: Phosphopentomutase [Pseudidiomarina mangrovi]
MARVIIVVLDSFGIGAAADADAFGDVGADTFGHIAAACAAGGAEQGRSGPLAIPNLLQLGLAQASYGATGVWPELATAIPQQPQAAYGWAQELSSGKDTPSGHWELTGVPVLFDWGYFRQPENSFPESLLAAIVAAADVPGYLGNCHASGTEILQRLGEQHMATGKPIIYTSADSVLQIAAHEQSFGLERLYQLCEITRVLLEPYNIGRVIARPFTGTDASNFKRTSNRRDYSLPPPAPTVLQKLTEAGGQVISIGKIADIFAHIGISKAIKGTGIAQLTELTIEHMKTAPQRSIIFTNLVDFDSEYGHRRDIAGYARALEYFDTLIPALLQATSSDDLLIFTADHGNDPSWPGSDHTREYVPLLVYRPGITATNLGRRESFADIGQTIADYLGLSAMDYGTSFLPELLRDA